MHPGRLALAFAILLVLPTVPLAPNASAAIPPECLAQVNVDVALVIDRSGSMTDANRMVLAKAASGELLRRLKPTDQSALVSFASDVRLDRNLTTSHLAPAAGSTEAAVNALAPGGGTQIWKGIRMAYYELTRAGPFWPAAPYSSNAGRFGGVPVMVVLSDGDQNDPYPTPESEAQRAKNGGITVYSIVLGNSVSAAGRATMRAVATSPNHYFEVRDGDPLDQVFISIAERVRDLHPPTVQITRPTLNLYDHDVLVPSGTVSLPSLIGPFTPEAVATDDCSVKQVAFQVDEYDDQGGLVATRNAGIDTSAPYAGHFDCHQLAGGEHVLRAIVTDGDGKTAVDERRFYCVRAALDARATSVHVRLTNPIGPNVSAKGAHLPTTLGGEDETLVATYSAAWPVAFDATALNDWVKGYQSGATSATLHADARSRLANVTLPGIPERLDVLETQAHIDLDAVPRPPGLTFTWASGSDVRGVRAVGAASAAQDPDPSCTTLQPDPSDPFADSVHTCVGDIVLLPDGKLLLDERIIETREGFRSVTVNGAHLILERPEGRFEVILAQSYAAASYLGERGLRLGAPARTLNAERDASVPGDAPDAWQAALPLQPGVYGGRIRDAGDADAYSVQANVGEKVRFDVTPSHEARMGVGALPDASATPHLPAFYVLLVDPDGAVRDSRGAILAEPVGVELNVDIPGAWTVLVASGGREGDYTLTVARTGAPMLSDNDALLGEDAPETCADAALVGPGVHVGAIEDKLADPTDFYRFQVFEGQAVAITLRPGDTLDSTYLSLYVYDPACNLISHALVIQQTGHKGQPQTFLLTDLVGSLGFGEPVTGLYRAEVRHQNGIGTYELAITPSVVTLPN